MSLVTTAVGSRNCLELGGSSLPEGGIAAAALLCAAGTRLSPAGNSNPEVFRIIACKTHDIADLRAVMTDVKLGR